MERRLELDELSDWKAQYLLGWSSVSADKSRVSLHPSLLTSLDKESENKISQDLKNVFHNLAGQPC